MGAPEVRIKTLGAFFPRLRRMAAWVFFLACVVGIHPPLWANPAELHVGVLADGSYEIKGVFVVKASSALVWSVLTDYDNLSGFVDSMRSSRVLERREEHILIEQDAVGRALFFRRSIHVILKVREEPVRKIFFEDISKKDFSDYAGLWEIVNEAGSVNVTYHLIAKPHFAAPGFITRSVFKKTVRSLLEKVESEILRRHPPGEDAGVQREN